MNQLEISKSKSKLIFSISISIVFIFIGTNILTSVENLKTDFHYYLVKGIGIANIIFFGVLGIVGITKFLQKHVAIIISDHGIVDNILLSKNGLIKWDEILEIKTQKVLTTTILLVFFKNPNQIIEKEKEINLKRINFNLQKYGTPLIINPAIINYDIVELEKIMKSKLRKNKMDMPNG
jgi:hypothetical protein